MRGDVGPRLHTLAHHGDFVAFHFDLLLEEHQIKLHLDSVEVLLRLGICHRALSLQHRLAQDFSIGVAAHLGASTNQRPRVGASLSHHRHSFL